MIDNIKENIKIDNHIIEYLEETHTYIIDGIIVPSITTIMKIRFGKKYDNVSKKVLDESSKKGTEMHKIIELYETENLFNDESLELKNYIFLKNHHKWEVLDSEILVILFDENRNPIGAGRLDQVIKIDDKIGINDLKRTSTFDKEYVSIQTNLYRIAYMQTYGKNIDFVSGLHLRDTKRKFYKLPINEDLAMEVVKDYYKENICK